MKNILIITCFLCLISVFAQAEDFTVSGIIAFIKKGTITVKLVSETEFLHPENVRFKSVLHISSDELEKGIISFQFSDIPRGRYAIRCFQDVNGNGKLDMGWFGPDEPYAFFKPVYPFGRAPNFAETSFQIDQNTSDIDIVLK